MWAPLAEWLWAKDMINHAYYHRMHERVVRVPHPTNAEALAEVNAQGRALAEIDVITKMTTCRLLRARHKAGL